MMGIKKFTAATMQKALKQIREDLGDDAIIVSNRKLPNGKVEISVSCEGEEQSDASKSLVVGSAASAAYGQANSPQRDPRDRSTPSGIEPLKISNEKAKQLLAAVRTSQQSNHPKEIQSALPVAESEYPVPSMPGYAPHVDMTQLIQTTLQNSMHGQLQNTVVQLQQEIHALREEVKLSAVASSHADSIKKPVAADKSEPARREAVPPSQNRKAFAVLHKKWRQLGIDDAIFNQFCKSPQYLEIQHQSEPHIWKASLGFLKNLVPRYTRNPVETPGVYAFVGPTGAGKTTTLAKLAVRQVNRWGADQVGIVTMDSFRIGAWEQMQRLGDIIGVKTALCRQEDSLLETLGSMRHCRSILIDTAGLSHQDERRLVQWQKLAELGDELEAFLVAQANLQSKVLEQLTQAYKPAQVRGLIYTKCDEITSLGEAVSTLINARLPWVFACDGQTIPDDLKAMTVDTVVQMLLKTTQQKHWKLGGHASEQEALLVKAMGE